MGSKVSLQLAQPEQGWGRGWGEGAQLVTEGFLTEGLCSGP